MQLLKELHQRGSLSISPVFRGAVRIVPSLVRFEHCVYSFVCSSLVTDALSSSLGYASRRAAIHAVSTHVDKRARSDAAALVDVSRARQTRSAAHAVPSVVSRAVGFETDAIDLLGMTLGAQVATATTPGAFATRTTGTSAPLPIEALSYDAETALVKGAWKRANENGGDFFAVIDVSNTLKRHRLLLA